jgi:hypothetical protein
MIPGILNCRNRKTTNEPATAANQALTKQANFFLVILSAKTPAGIVNRKSGNDAKAGMSDIRRRTTKATH